MGFFFNFLTLSTRTTSCMSTVSQLYLAHLDAFMYHLGADRANISFRVPNDDNKGNRTHRSMEGRAPALPLPSPLFSFSSWVSRFPGVFVSLPRRCSLRHPVLLFWLPLGFSFSFFGSLCPSLAPKPLPLPAPPSWGQMAGLRVMSRCLAGPTGLQRGRRPISAASLCSLSPS